MQSVKSVVIVLVVFSEKLTHIWVKPKTTILSRVLCECFGYEEVQCNLKFYNVTPGEGEGGGGNKLFKNNYVVHKF